MSATRRKRSGQSIDEPSALPAKPAERLAALA
jgi:hypothetical protein